LIRALLLGCAGVILVIVVVRGLVHYTPAQPQPAHAPAHLYASTANDGMRSVLATRKPSQRPAAIPLHSRPINHVPSARAASAGGTQAHAASQPASATEQNTLPTSDLAARFPPLAHQAIIADPSGGTEAQYFLRLGNLLNGTPLPPGQIGPNADRLANAQADLDRDDFAGAIAETERLSGPAARVMSGWLADARRRVASHHAAGAPTRVAEATPQTRAWPNVMPTEIPHFARQSSGPPPAP